MQLLHDVLGGREGEAQEREVPEPRPPSLRLGQVQAAAGRGTLQRAGHGGQLTGLITATTDNKPEL